MNRREALREIASKSIAIGGILVGTGTMMVHCQPTPAPAAEPRRLTESWASPGWYALGPHHGTHRVMWASVAERGRVALSEGPKRRPTIYVTQDEFDEVCVGRVRTADEADRQAGRGRYGRAA